MADIEDFDPLDAAFANPKAGKKLKAGETLPDLGIVSEVSLDASAVPDDGMSRALDEAFSNPNFGMEPQNQTSSPVPDAALGTTEAEMAQTIDDAFANPKAGNKISENQGGLGGFEGINHGAGDPDLTYRDNSLHDLGGKPSGGLLSPKTLVIGMIVLACVLVAMSLGQSAETAPTMIRMDN